MFYVYQVAVSTSDSGGYVSVLLCLFFFFFCFFCGFFVFFFFQAEDGIRDLVRSRGLGDVYKRQRHHHLLPVLEFSKNHQDMPLRALQAMESSALQISSKLRVRISSCLLYTSDAADERSSVDLGGRRIIKKKTQILINGTLYKDINKDVHQKIKKNLKQER